MDEVLNQLAGPMREAAAKRRALAAADVTHPDWPRLQEQYYLALVGLEVRVEVALKLLGVQWEASHGA